MCFAANGILLTRNCSHTLVGKIADRSLALPESHLNMTPKLSDQMLKQLLNTVIAKMS